MYWYSILTVANTNIRFAGRYRSTDANTNIRFAGRYRSTECIGIVF